MHYEERPPPPGLEDLVSRLWFLEAPRVRRFEKILPLPFVHLIVNLSDPYAVYDRSGAPTPVGETFLSGLQTEFLVIESPPVIRHVGVEVLPAGLGAVTDAAGPAVAGRVQDARALVPGLEDVAAAGRRDAPEVALDRLVDVLLARRARTRSRPDPLVIEALAALDADPNRPVSDLVAGASQRTLLSRFRTATGLSPKSYAQVLRFHRLVTGLADPALDGREAGAAAWSAVAVESGYYDQPHVIRAFRRFCGWTPAEYARRVAEFGADAALFVPLDEVPVSPLT
ncbi:AraC family transcriptional regulator [Ornithinimicrobium sp. F0845]|uniref:helix-turn-helix domain-containing protein n=1 Tax=Ornithinimicrobium sp. F0845 TaxID=2926412 RepID=UPI001FF592CA|nr:AraC family transcriptional regulator [Ornithinimicrobium sp. F0845]MCK0112436.1 AraC family transcriptional regulator [Ornithinimicrobium sp. F0845]